jgi:hypothetical protein
VPRSTAQPAAVPVSKAAISCVFLGVRIYYGEVAWLWLSARESPSRKSTVRVSDKWNARQ